MAQVLDYPHFIPPNFFTDRYETSSPPPYPAAGPSELSADVDPTMLVQCMSSCTSLRVGDDPSSLIPVCQRGADPSSCQLWLGDDRDQELLKSEQSVLLEVRDFSRLIFGGDVSADALEKLRELEGNVKILVPSAVANKVGFSNFAYVGPVTQYSVNGTFVLKKISSPEECAPYETTVYEDDGIFSLLRIPPEVNPEMDSELETDWDTSDDIEEADEKFRWSMLPELAKWSVGQMMSRRLILTAAGIRFVFCWLAYWKGEPTSGQPGVWSLSTYASYLAGMRRSLGGYLSLIATRLRNFF